MDQSLNYQVHTFGCKVNTYDTGLIQKNLNQSGFKVGPVLKLEQQQTVDPKKPAVHILNTCAVTGEATQQAVRYIRKLKSKDPFCTIVVTGCAAQVDTGKFSDLPGADLVVANSHKAELPQLIQKHLKGLLTEKVFKSNIFKKEDLEVGGGIEQSHTRSFLKIQDGCNSFCSYCIIPYARGKSRSIPAAQLVSKINELVSQGLHEVVLTGVHIGDYHDENLAETGIEGLLETILLKTKIERIRLSSLEPVELSERLFELYANPRLCRHFHMSIQSAQTTVLKDMKRNYGKEEVQKALSQISEKLPGSYVGMDVIVGFPTETEEQFEETYLTLAALPWTRIHVFPYSERTGTKAAVMESSVEWSVRTRRAAKLRELSLARSREMALTQVGSIKQTLILKKASKGAQGLSRDYWPIQIQSMLNSTSSYNQDSVSENLQSFAGREINVKISGLAEPTAINPEPLLIGDWVL